MPKSDGLRFIAHSSRQSPRDAEYSLVCRFSHRLYTVHMNIHAVITRPSMNLQVVTCNYYLRST